MLLEDLIMSFLTLLGLAVMITFAITGVKSAYEEIKKEKKASMTIDEHFDSIVRQ